MSIVFLVVGFVIGASSIFVALIEAELKPLIGFAVGLALMLFPVIPASNYQEIPHEIISNVVEIEEQKIVFSEPMKITWTEVKVNHWSYDYLKTGNKDYKVEAVK